MKIEAPRVSLDSGMPQNGAGRALDAAALLLIKGAKAQALEAERLALTLPLPDTRALDLPTGEAYRISNSLSGLDRQQPQMPHEADWIGLTTDDEDTRPIRLGLSSEPAEAAHATRDATRADPAPWTAMGRTGPETVPVPPLLNPADLNPDLRLKPRPAAWPAREQAPSIWPWLSSGPHGGLPSGPLWIIRGPAIWMGVSALLIALAYLYL